METANNNPERDRIFDALSLPFGKYRGLVISKFNNVGYMKWALENWTRTAPADVLGALARRINDLENI